MWSNLLYMAPVASILSKCVVDEEIKMEGNLSEELQKLFKKYAKNPNFRFIKTKISAKVYATYPIGTSLWTILDGVMTLFHLIAYVNEFPGGVITLELREGSSWKH